MLAVRIDGRGGMLGWIDGRFVGRGRRVGCSDGEGSARLLEASAAMGATERV